MNHSIDQISVVYELQEDRLLMKVGFSGQQELAVWLTRRFVRVFWSGLMKCLHSDPLLMARDNPRAKQDVMAFQNENALSKADFSTQYRSENRAQPAGFTPLLVCRLQVKPLEDNRTLLTLSDAHGVSIKIRLSHELIFSLCKLLQDSTEKAGWGLSLKLADAARAPQAGDTIN